MVVIADFVLPPDEFVLGGAISAVPDVSIDLAGTAASPDVSITPYVDVRGGRRQLARFERALAEDPTAADATTLVETDDGRSYRIRWSRSDVIETFNAALQATDLSPTEITFENENRAWRFRFRCNDRRLLSEFHEAAREELAFELLSVTDRAASAREMPLGVTAAQREALLAALELGYYTVPRGCHATDVANELGISPPAVSQRLRRGHENVLRSTLIV